MTSAKTREKGIECRRNENSRVSDTKFCNETISGMSVCQTQPQQKQMEYVSHVTGGKRTTCRKFQMRAQFRNKVCLAFASRHIMAKYQFAPGNSLIPTRVLSRNKRLISVLAILKNDNLQDFGCLRRIMEGSYCGALFSAST